MTWLKGLLQFGHGGMLPLEIVSGRSGRRLWSGGPVAAGLRSEWLHEIAGIDLRACEPRGPMDLIVRHQGRYCAAAARALARMSFAAGPPGPRIGRDGHVIWDVTLVEQRASRMAKVPELPHEFGDVDGDGGLDIIVLLDVNGPAGRSFERRAISLRDGKTLWSHAHTISRRSAARIRGGRPRRRRPARAGRADQISGE